MTFSAWESVGLPIVIVIVGIVLIGIFFALMLYVTVKDEKVYGVYVKEAKKDKFTVLGGQKL